MCRGVTIIKEGRRRRYIGFEINSKQTFSFSRSEVIVAIKKKCKVLFDKECKDLGIYLTRFDGMQGIVRCNLLEKDHTIKLLTSIDSVSQVEIDVQTLATSGTIKSLIKKHMPSLK